MKDGAMPLEKLTTEVSKLVPVERARAQVESDRRDLARRRKYKKELTARRLTDDALIASGQRRVVQWSINQQIKSGRFERFDKKGVPYVQLPSPKTRKLKGDASSWTKRGMELLQDGPMSLPVLVGQVWTLVPPGQAWRSVEKSRFNSSGRPERKRQRSDEDLQEQGSRAIARDAFLRLVKTKQLLQREIDGVLWVALLEHADRLAAIQTAPDSSAAEELKRELVHAVQHQPDGTLLRLATRIRRVAGQVEEWDPFGGGKNGEVPGVVSELRQLATAMENHASRPSADVTE